MKYPFAFAVIFLALALNASAQLNSPREQFPFSSGETDVLNIYCVTHGSIALETGGEFIYIDPVSEIGPGVYFFTHEHEDHLSQETIKYLKGITGNEASIFGTRNCIDAIGKGNIMKNGDSVTLSLGGHEVKVTAIPAYNTTKGRENFHPVGRDNGYLFEIGGLTVYLSGDTEPVPAMSELGKVDVALLNVSQPYTMSVEQCIEVARIINPAVLIPYHLGSTDVTAIADAFAGTSIEVRCHRELR